MQKFKDELATPDVDYVIMVGDLFDHPHVGFGVVCEAAEAVRHAARKRPFVEFVLMAGNHDLPRNLSVVGAWDAFEQMVNNREGNLRAIRQPTAVHGVLLMPWDWSLSAAEQASRFAGPSTPVAIGHWDLQSYGGDDSHIAPVAELAALGVTEFYSGHYHTEGNYPVGDHMVRCTGSMEPYTHGEDPEGEIYITVTLAELEALPAEDLREKCVRVRLAEGEEMPTGLDCFALTPLRTKSEAAEIETVSLADFDWNKILADALAPLDPEVRTFITERLTG